MDPEELARVTLPAEPESVRAARATVARALDGRVDDDVHDAAMVVISELASNAMLHAETPFQVVVRSGAAGIRLEVHDGNARLPRRKRYSSEATTGRGLVLVEALTTVAGADRTEDGKVVWALLSEAPPSPPMVGHDAGTGGDAGPVAAPVPGGSSPPHQSELQVAAQDDTWELRARLWAGQLESVAV